MFGLTKEGMCHPTRKVDTGEGALSACSKECINFRFMPVAGRYGGGDHIYIYIERERERERENFVSQNVFGNNGRTKKTVDWVFVLKPRFCNVAAITSVAPLVDANMFAAALSFLIIKKVGFHENQNVF